MDVTWPSPTLHAEKERASLLARLRALAAEAAAHLESQEIHDAIDDGLPAVEAEG